MNIQQINSKRFEVSCTSSLSSKRDRFRRGFRAKLVKLLPHMESYLWREKLIGKKLSKNQVDKISMGVHFCGNRKIRSLNREFRGKETPTDVLSFPLYDLRKEKNFVGGVLDGELNIGDIFICLDVANRQAKGFDVTLSDELIHLFVHGFLHLLGFDHEISAREEKLMESLEEMLIGKLAKMGKIGK